MENRKPRKITLTYDGDGKNNGLRMDWETGNDKPNASIIYQEVLPTSDVPSTTLDDAEIERSIKDYVESCDNESGSFLSRDLMKIRTRAVRHGLSLRASIDAEAIRAKAWKECIEICHTYADVHDPGEWLEEEAKRRGVKL